MRKIFCCLYAVAVLLPCGLMAVPLKPGVAFDAYAWYLPYGQVLRVDYELSADEWKRLEGADPQVVIEVKSPTGKAILEKTLPAERDIALDVNAMRERGDTKGLQFKLPLEEGTYTATVQIKKGDGTVEQSMSNPIVVRKYAFEHNTIGKERVVIPPFEAIKAAANHATVWGREFSFAPSGLPEKIVVLGKDILAPGGARLLLKEGETTEELKPSGPPFSIKTTDGYDATGSVQGKIGELSYQLNGRLEYDGSYFVHLEIESGKPVPVHSLTLLIPFTQETDTFSFQKNDRDTRSTGGYARFDGIPSDMQGVIWDARKLPQKSPYGWSCDNFFVPAIYVGSGSRGLWYYSESDWDWYLNPANEHATLERVDGRVQLRVLLVNDELEWKGKRVFDFVLMPQPVKPMPAGWRKVAWGYPTKPYVHDTSGWRYYGDGVNAFSLPTDEDYRQLGRVMAGEAPNPANSRGPGKIKGRDDPRPLVLYGSNLMAGAGPAQGEWDTYASEWVGPAFSRQACDQNTKERFLGKKSYGGFEYKDDISFKPCSSQWMDSWLDFFLFYHQKLVTLAGVNGTWFDNQSTFTIDGYTEDGFERRLLENPGRWKPANGEVKRAQNYGRVYHILQFRKLLKRLSTMCYTAGVQPLWLVNQQPTWSFAQLAWHIEGDWYAEKTQRDLVDHMGVAGFRAHVSSQGGLIPRIDFESTSGIAFDQPNREGHPATLGVRTTDATNLELPGAKRTNAGLSLIHDVGSMKPDMLVCEKLDREFGFFDEGIEFLPYWSQKSVMAGSDHIYTSVFRNPARKRTMAVLFNDKKEGGLTFPLRISESLNVHDLETGEPLVDLDPKTPDLQTQCYVPSRDFRILVWETK